MSIRDNILAVKKQLLNELDAPQHPRSEEVQKKALLAIRKGDDSDDWKTYMKLFVDNAGVADDPTTTSGKQLLRLIGKDSKGGLPEFDDRRAYLAADGTCTTETVTNFGRNASVALDADLQ
jgi:hypothetical protein